jgi:hypothetical protein
LEKSGYLSKKLSNGRNYLYIRQSYRLDGKVKHKYLYSFGAMPSALDKMYDILNNPETFPDKLKENGFNLNDLQEWVFTVETRTTSTGRKFVI